MLRSVSIAVGQLFLGLCVVAGCARSPEPVIARPPVYPAGGRLLVCDRQAGGAHLAFFALNKSGATVSIPTAITAADGTFRVRTFDPDDGAPEGEYVVTVLWPNASIPVDECEPAVHDRLGGLYFDAAKSQLRATVRPGTNDITIHATVGGTGWNLPRLADVGTALDRRDSRDRELRDRELRERR